MTASAWRRSAGAAHLALAGVLTGLLAFQAGGFFPAPVAVAAVALAVLLVLRLTVARRPYEGWGPHAVVVLAVLAALACWTLASAFWSGAPARALPEFDRVLLYGLAFALVAAFPRRPGDLSVLLRWVLAAIVAAAVAGLATRLYPDVFVAMAGRQPSRLAHPLTYWNALSVLCAIGAVLALHAASGEQEPPLVRILAGAALPVLVVAGYFPFSRGGIATALIGLALYVLVAHPRRMLLTVVTAGPAAAVGLIAAYGADALATNAYAQPPGPEQGHRLALVLALAAAGAAVARAALLPAEQRLDVLRPSLPRARAVWAIVVVAVAAGAAAGIALGGADRVRDQYDAFVSGNVVQESSDARDRLGASGNNGRLDIWRVAAHAFRSEPLTGTGAGTFQLEWERERAADVRVVDGHSLYLETLGELGVPGLAALLVALGALLAAWARRLRGPDRHAAAACIAAGVALLVHAGIDWDWEMPALMLWLFMAGGVACARPAGHARGGEPGRVARIAAALGCLVLAATPLSVAASQTRLDRARDAFARGDCAAAVDAALDSRDALSVRPEPFELLGYCDLRAGQPALAVQAMEAARARDPDAWQYAYGLAVARAMAGGDPRAAAAEARRLNPREPRAHRLVRALAGTDPERRRRAAARAQLPF